MAETQCIIPDCTRIAYCRGLCHACYTLAGGLVRSGSTSWNELTANGLAVTPKAHRQSSPMMAAFKKLKGKAEDTDAPSQE